jgi:hypothetical protein
MLAAKHYLHSHLTKAISRLKRAEQIASAIGNNDVKQHILNAIDEVNKALKEVVE